MFASAGSQATVTGTFQVVGFEYHFKCVDLLFATRCHNLIVCHYIHYLMACWLFEGTEQLILKTHVHEKVTVLYYIKIDSYAFRTVLSYTNAN